MAGNREDKKEEVFDLFGSSEDSGGSPEGSPGGSPEGSIRGSVSKSLANKLLNLDESLGGHVTGFLGRNAEDLVSESNIAPQGEDAHPGTGWIHPPEEVDFSTGWLEEDEELLDPKVSLPVGISGSRKEKRVLRRLKWKSRLFSPRTLKFFGGVATIFLFYLFFSFLIKSGSIV